MKRIANAIFSFLTSKIMVAIGLILSAWSIFSIEITCFPKIPSALLPTKIERMNKVFLALAYSYVAGVILYWFTAKFPYARTKKRVSPVIERKIERIGQQLLNMSCEFGNTENLNITDVEEIIESITHEQWAKPCKIPFHTHRVTLQRRSSATIRPYNILYQH